MLLSFSLTASSSSNRDSSSSVEGSNVARFSGKKFDNSYAEIAIGSLELLTAYLANTLFFSLQMIKPIAVSYTHLTLPTTSRV